MAKQMIIVPGKCIGCSTCALTCSFTYHGQFNPNKAHITIIKNDFEGIFKKGDGTPKPAFRRTRRWSD